MEGLAALEVFLFIFANSWKTEENGKNVKNIKNGENGENSQQSLQSGASSTFRPSLERLAALEVILIDFQSFRRVQNSHNSRKGEPFTQAGELVTG